jgi:hypothetical protein
MYIPLGLVKLYKWRKELAKKIHINKWKGNLHVIFPITQS